MSRIIKEITQMNQVIVIGGGASGMISAIFSAKNGNSVTLIEKNEKLGKKIYITGKGRCNLTNNVDKNEFLENVISNPKFLYSAIYSFPPEKTIEFFEELGLKLKTERGHRVFPVSDKASDVTKYLEKKLRELNVNVVLNTNVYDIIVENGHVLGVKISNGKVLSANSVIIATGGVSYPLTGSTGDGYKFALETGHSVTALKPALVGIDLYDNLSDVQGLSLKNVRLNVLYNEKTYFSEFGESLFTHFGISGPIVLTCSSKINRLENDKIKLFLDLKPALSVEQLDKKFITLFEVNNNKEICNVLRVVLPKSLIGIFLKKCSINSQKTCSLITTEERKKIINTLKSFALSYKGLRPIEEAVVTSGGVSVKDINPKTMESKIVKGLFYAGEVIDCDALTGGFNLQIAFSTGRLAGINS